MVRKENLTEKETYWIAAVRSRPTKRVRVTGIILLICGIAYPCLYFVVPLYLPRTFCPPGTFLDGSMLSLLNALGLMIGVILPPGVSLILVLLAAPRNAPLLGPRLDALREHRIGLALAACAGFAASVVLAVNATFQYFCVTPVAILTHPDTLGHTRLLTWNDVKVVRGHCFSGTAKTRSSVSLDLSLTDGSEISLRLGGYQSFETRSYEAVRAALAGKSYRYDTGDLPNCPKNIRDVLADWPN
jgi:hypothetical protein